MLWTKGAHQSGNFQTFDHSHENLTKFLKLFFIPRVTFPLNFASSFSVMTQSSFEVFWLEHYMRLTENVHQCTIFQTFSALMKVHPIPHALFETTRSGFDPSTQKPQKFLL